VGSSRKISNATSAGDSGIFNPQSGMKAKRHCINLRHNCDRCSTYCLDWAARRILCTYAAYGHPVSLDPPGLPEDQHAFKSELNVTLNSIRRVGNGEMHTDRLRLTCRFRASLPAVGNRLPGQARTAALRDLVEDLLDLAAVDAEFP
jgi:hypothetical protein